MSIDYYLCKHDTKELFDLGKNNSWYILENSFRRLPDYVLKYKGLEEYVKPFIIDDKNLLKQILNVEVFMPLDENSTAEEVKDSEEYINWLTEVLYLWSDNKPVNIIDISSGSIIIPCVFDKNPNNEDYYFVTGTRYLEDDHMCTNMLWSKSDILNRGKERVSRKFIDEDASPRISHLLDLKK